MSYFGFRFDKINPNESDEIKNLYRVRDNDPEWAEFYRKFAVNHMTSDNKMSVNLISKNYNKPVDPVYEAMTETERIECGRPTKFVNLVLSKPMIFVMSLWFNIGVYQYSKIYVPGGIVLMAQRKETMYQYFSRRLPIISFAAFLMYILKIHTLNYVIDYYSPEEDD